MFLRIKTAFFAIITVVVSLVIADLLLHTAALFSSRVDDVVSVAPKFVPDARLGHRPNPAFPDHDANGFRNSRVPARADIVALGDSHTYGAGVKAEQAWPRVLESRLQHSVYSMAFGGYGPVHSLLLWDEALVLKPRIIIEAVYSGNDIFDSYHEVYTEGRVPYLKTTDAGQIGQMAQAEATGTLYQRVAGAYYQGERTEANTESLRKSIKSWLKENSRVYGLLWRARYELDQFRDKKRDQDQKWQKAKSRADRNPQFTQWFEGDSARTVFTSEYRLSVLDLEDPRVREGQRIVLEALSRMQAMASRGGIRFIVLLIPTKELVFAELASALDSPSYHGLVGSEMRFWAETKKYLNAHSIEYVDALPSLRAQLDSGPQPYKVSDDGHPNEHGHRAIAEAIRVQLENAL